MDSHTPETSEVTPPPLEQLLAEAWHDGYEWQYGACDHGTYSGGLSHGKPYKMCEIQAGSIAGRLMADPERLLTALVEQIMRQARDMKNTGRTDHGHSQV